jgi:hypothetical protein
MLLLGAWCVARSRFRRRMLRNTWGVEGDVVLMTLLRFLLVSMRVMTVLACWRQGCGAHRAAACLAHSSQGRARTSSGTPCV